MLIRERLAEKLEEIRWDPYSKCVMDTIHLDMKNANVTLYKNGTIENFVIDHLRKKVTEIQLQ